MEMSESINELAAALAKAQAAFTAVPKGKEAKVQMKSGGEYRYKYADLADALDVCRKPLSENGLSVLQPPEQFDRGVIGVTTLLLHTSGQWIKSVLTLDARDATPQSVGTIITYARRYSLAGMIGLVTDDDTDAQEHGKPRQGGPARYDPPPRRQESAPPVQQARTETTTSEAEAKFFEHYGDTIGGTTWQAAQRYFGHLMPKPTTVEEWRTVAKEIAAKQKASA